MHTHWEYECVLPPPSCYPSGLTGDRAQPLLRAGGYGRRLGEVRDESVTGRAGVRARPERREVAYGAPRPGRYPPDLPGAGTVLANDSRRPGLAGRASHTGKQLVCARYCIASRGAPKGRAWGARALPLGPNRH